MATTKNITMKQFNGTDYDTLYPKTKVEQVENLTPSSIGAVSKTGDTMTGNLTIQNSSYPDINLKNTGSGSTTKIRNSAHRTQIMSEEDDNNYRALTLNDKIVTTDAKNILQIQQIDGGVQTAVYNVLHTGNLSNLGVARIQTGSYVGTGTYGSDNPCSLTFDFIPKFIIFTNRKVGNGKCLNTLDNTAYIMLNTQILTTAYVEGTGFGYEGSRRPYGAKSEDGKTIYWWSQDAAGQLNAQNETCYWVAFG